MSYRYTWTDRLHAKQDFARVIRTGRRFSLSGIVLWVHREENVQRRARLGFAVPGSYGNAVSRNRIRRLLREVFRLHKAHLARGADLVFSAKPQAKSFGYATLEPIVKELWTRADIYR